MQGIRSHRMPDLLLPNFQSAVEYLQDEVLCHRLVEITSSAEATLSMGQSTIQLFDGDLDATKVHESCTIFALAAISLRSKETAHLFVHLIQVYFGGPNETVMRFFEEQVEDDAMFEVLSNRLLAIAEYFIS